MPGRPRAGRGVRLHATPTRPAHAQAPRPARRAGGAPQIAGVARPPPLAQRGREAPRPCAPSARSAAEKRERPLSASTLARGRPRRRRRPITARVAGAPSWAGNWGGGAVCGGTAAPPGPARAAAQAGRAAVSLAPTARSICRGGGCLFPLLPRLGRAPRPSAAGILPRTRRPGGWGGTRTTRPGGRQGSPVPAPAVRAGGGAGEGGGCTPSPTHTPLLSPKKERKKKERTTSR